MVWMLCGRQGCPRRRFLTVFQGRDAPQSAERITLGGRGGGSASARLIRHKLERIAPADNVPDRRRGKVCRADQGGGVADTIEELSPRLASLPRVVVCHHPEL